MCVKEREREPRNPEPYTWSLNCKYGLLAAVGCPLLSGSSTLETMLCSGTDLESYITKYTLVYEDNVPRFGWAPLLWDVHFRQVRPLQNNCLAEMWSGSEEGSYLRFKGFVLLNSRLESNKEEEEKSGWPPLLWAVHFRQFRLPYQFRRNSKSGTSPTCRLRVVCQPTQSRMIRRFGANVAHIRRSRPDSGLGFQVKALKSFRIVASLFGSGKEHSHHGVWG